MTASRTWCPTIYRAFGTAEKPDENFYRYSTKFELIERLGKCTRHSTEATPDS